MAERDTSFGDLLRAYRAEARLTQEALAARAGLSLDAVGMLERGVRRSPRRSTVLLLADALRLSSEQRDALVASAWGGRASPGTGRPPEPRAGIPPDPAPHFAGRGAELADLRRLLRQDRRVAVHGLGGVGKTLLVACYLHRRRGEYPDGVFWLRADEETSLVGDLASLAWRLELPERHEPEQERQVEAVLRWLREHRQWLLVLDDVEAPAAEAMRRWLPPGLPGHLLLTSRTPMWSVRLGLQPLPEAVARRFLLERTGQADDEASGAVAETLGCLPLALEQAAAYLEMSGRDLASYAQLLRTRLLELMMEGKPADYPRPVATTWQLCFERMEAERPAAAALLRLCAFLAPDDIPISVLVAGARVLPQELRDALTDGLELDRAIAALRGYSLMDRQGDRLRVHRLVQVVVRESLGPDQRQAWLAAAIRLLRAEFPDEVGEHPERWPLCARLLPHVQAAEQFAGDRTVEPQALGWLVDRVGVYLVHRVQFGLARPPHERALALRERALGPDHPDTAESLSDLGWVLYLQGHLTAGRRLWEQTLAIRERVLGPDHPDTAMSLHSMAILHRHSGELTAARSLQERALAIWERTLEPDHGWNALGLNNLGQLLIDQGELAAARAPLERALAIRGRALGPGHPETARSLHNLAVLHRHEGEPAAARALLERALAIRERLLGPDHPHTGESLQELAIVHRDGGDPAVARPMFERALAIRERTLGPEHPHVADCLTHLAILHRRQGEPVVARALQERALAILERTAGPDHPLNAMGLDNLGQLLVDQGEPAAAKPLFERALAIRTRVLGADHPRTATSLNDLALLHLAQGELDAARPLLERAQAIRERDLGPDHHDTVATRRALAELAGEADGPPAGA